MRAMQGFSGINILTYTILSNHFHILLEVPGRIDISDEELFRRLRYIYDPTHVKLVAATIRDFRKEGQNEAADRIKAGYTYRMYDISEFFKTLKQKFSQWYNKRNVRNGTLWEQRFKSGFSREKVEDVLQRGGKLPMHILLRCQVRYFSDGLVLGSKEFVDDVFLKYRDQFGLKRATGARPMKHGHWDGLCTMRDLKFKPVAIC